MSTGNRRTIQRAPIMPERVRAIGSRGFAYIPNRFVQDAFYTSLTRDEAALYLLLVMVGDRNGLSFYHFDSLCSLLQLPLEIYLLARDGLIDADLIAFDGTRFQVLELPQRPVSRRAKPLVTDADRERSDPASIRAALRRALDSDGTEDR